MSGRPEHQSHYQEHQSHNQEHQAPTEIVSLFSLSFY